MFQPAVWRAWSRDYRAGGKPVIWHIVIFVCYALCGAVGAVLLFSTQMPNIFASLIVQGLGRGSLMAIALLVLMETRGVDASHMGAAGGLFFSAAEIGGVLGPLTVGIISDVTGGFTVALNLMSAICVGLIVLLAWLRRSEARAALRG